MAGRILSPLTRLSRSPIVGRPAAGSTTFGALLRRDLQDGGHHYIAGSVTVNTIPARRQVRLYDLRSGRLIRATWSAENGAYEFQNINGALQYLVLAHDYQAIYNAVVADFVTPEVMA